MNKGQGLAISGLLAAALLLRQTGSDAPQLAAAAENGKGTATTEEPLSAREGPWIASCNYWAPARKAEQKPLRASPEIATFEVKVGETDLHGHVADSDQVSACATDQNGRWGFPARETPVNVTAIVATVADPVHTHLSLTFDRTIDEILQAASDNDYVSSYYWLPWKNRGGGTKFAESQDDAEPGHRPERERQPGLIVLKPGNKHNQSSFYNVIYIFLVAETPTQGVDGYQLQNAFLYEAQLKAFLAARGQLFSTGLNNRITILGPQFSGSAASLRVGIETAQKNLGLGNVEFVVAGTTSTSLPPKQLSGDNPKIKFSSFADDWDYDLTVLLKRLADSGYKAERLALLVEDNTAASAALADEAIIDKNKLVQIVRFPREISLLRNAQVAGQSGAALSSGSAFSPYLHFSLKDYSAQDSVPQFSRENTPVSQESQLMAIARQLRQFRSQFIAIGASNVLDEIFLTQFLHRACPDARLLFFGADLLMVREIDNVPFIGSITITPYPLIGLKSVRRAQRSPRAHRFRERGIL